MAGLVRAPEQPPRDRAADLRSPQGRHAGPRAGPGEPVPPRHPPAGPPRHRLPAPPPPVLPGPPPPVPGPRAGSVMARAGAPATLARQANPAYRLITIVLMRCGLRASDAVGLPFDCVVRDADGAPYLRYYNRKMKREALVPVDEELEALIGSQQDRARERWPGGTPVLFPRPTATIDGHRPGSYTSYRDGLYPCLDDSYLPHH